jgi:hypothetical protein
LVVQHWSQQDALQLDGSKGGGSAGGGGGGDGDDELGSADIDDLDDYINALDAGGCVGGWVVIA